MIGFGHGRSLRHLRLQVILAIAAVGAAVALPVVLVSVGGGVSAHELANLENAGYQIVVSAGGLHGIEGAHALSAKILSVGSVTVASPVLSQAIDAYSPNGAVSPVLGEGVVPQEFTPTLGPTESGLFPSPLPLGDPSDSRHYANGTYAGPATYDVLISTPYEAASGVRVGQQILLSPTANRSLGTEYNVTGTFGVPPTFLGPIGAFAVLLPLSDLQVLTGYGPAPQSSVFDAADTVQVAVTGPVSTNPSALSAVQREVQKLVPFYTVSSLTQEAAQLESASAVLAGFYLALSSVGLTVGLLFLALVLLRRVEADRRSIGIRRALGVPGVSIVAGIVRDGFVLALLGSVAGLLGGYAIVEGLATYATSTVQEAARLAVFDPVILSEIVAGVVGLSLLASAVATRAALRVEITEALR
jgi:putative ABC transport system permease protein